MIADRVTDQLVLRNRPDLLAARPLIAGAVSGVVGGEAFATILRAAARDAHRAVFDRDQDSLTLTLADAGVVACPPRCASSGPSWPTSWRRRQGAVLLRERLGSVAADLARFGDEAGAARLGAAGAGRGVRRRRRRARARQAALRRPARARGARRGPDRRAPTAFGRAIALAGITGDDDPGGGARGLGRLPRRPDQARAAAGGDRRGGGGRRVVADPAGRAWTCAGCGRASRHGRRPRGCASRAAPRWSSLGALAIADPLGVLPLRSRSRGSQRSTPAWSRCCG